MSKKTKQEKIIADLRRQLETTRVNVSPMHSIYSVRNNTVKTSTIQPSQVTNNLSVSKDSLSLIKKDLTKTLILSILAISFELVLYFVLGTGTV